MEISPGLHVGSFEVLAPLGAGGMGTVYRALDPRLNRIVAIKFLQERLALQPEYLRRFEREARSASALNHPNIVTIFEIDEFLGAPFIAMELVEGTSLRDVLSGKPLRLRKLLEIATQMAEGLAAAHERGIVHRDVKPENVMITARGLVKILDFGLARLIRESDTEETAEIVESDSRVMGTAAYMSPEQASATYVDFRSDQFSFGSMLYEMATGKHPFRRASSAATLSAILHEDPVPAQHANPNLPPQLCWVIDRCLAKDPAERYASTTDLARELRTIREHLPETSPGIRLLPALRTSRTGGLFVGAVLAVVVGVGVYSRFPDSKGPPPPQLPAQKYLAVLPFRDFSGRPDGELFSRGLSDAVSARLAKLSGVDVIPLTPDSLALLKKNPDARRIAQELGANLLLSAGVQQSGDRLRLVYSIVEPRDGMTVAGNTVDGSVHDIWGLQDDAIAAIARDLGLEERRAPSRKLGLETAAEQDLYMRALGNLQRYDDEKALDAAIASLRELLETASESPLVHAALGRVYLEKYTLTRDRMWTEKALQACDRARALDPNSSEVLVTLGSVQRFTGQYDLATATFRRALSLQPNSPEANIGLGKSYEGAGKAEEAEQAFLRGIELRPTSWSGHNELGTFYLNRSRYDDALREYRQVIALNPRSASGHSNAGIVLVTQERLPEAIAAFTTAISFGESAFAYANLGNCFYFLGDFDKSAAAHRRAAALRPGFGYHWSNLADACRWSTQCRGEVDAGYRKAIELLRQELSVNPNNSKAHATLALCLAQIGAHSDARPHMTKALEISPQNGARMYQAARLANLRGDVDEAIEWLRRSIAAGYGEFDLLHEPEFRELRETKAFRAAFKKPVKAA